MEIISFTWYFAPSIFFPLSAFFNRLFFCYSRLWLLPILPMALSPGQLSCIWFLASFIQANIFYGEIKWSLSSYITNLCRMWTVLQPLHLPRLLLTTKNCRTQLIQPGSKQTNGLSSFWTLLFLRRLPLKLLDFLLLHRSGMLSKTRIATLRLNVYTVYVINFASWSKEPLLFLILAANLRPYEISYQPLDNLLMNRTSFIGFFSGCLIWDFLYSH